MISKEPSPENLVDLCMMWNCGGQISEFRFQNFESNGHELMRRTTVTAAFQASDFGDFGEIGWNYEHIQTIQSYW